MDIKTKAIIVGSAVLVSFAAGRFTVPEKVRIETKVVEVEKKDTKTKQDIRQNKKKKTQETITQKPDGSKQTVITIDEDSTTDDNKTSDAKSDTKVDEITSKEVVRGDSKVTVSALAGIDVKSGLPMYGASVYKPVLGPIGIGLWGLSNSSCGASIGVSF